MDFNVRRSHVMRVMIVVYAVFGISLIYFLFFNTGLKLTPSANADGGQVVVLNESVHAIRDISLIYVKDNEKQALGNIEILLPSESKSFPLTPGMVSTNGQIELQAFAPFHLAVRSIFDASNGNASDAQTTFQFSYPDTGYANESVETIVNGCNTSSAKLDLKVGVEIPSDPAMNPPAKDWSIPANDCASLPMDFMPGHEAGDLLLKIRVFTPWRTLGEGSHSIRILGARTIPSDSNGNDVNHLLSDNPSSAASGV